MFCSLRPNRLSNQKFTWELGLAPSQDSATEVESNSRAHL